LQSPYQIEYYDNDYTDGAQDIIFGQSERLYSVNQNSKSLNVFGYYDYAHGGSMYHIFSKKDTHLQSPYQIEYYDNVIYISNVDTNSILQYDVSSGVDAVYYGNVTDTTKPINLMTIESLKDFRIYDYLLYAVNDYYSEINIFSTRKPRNISLSNISFGLHSINVTCSLINGTIEMDTTNFNVINYDYDSDGINDTYDNCPIDYNPAQENSDYINVSWTRYLNINYSDEYSYLNFRYLDLNDMDTYFKAYDYGDACDTCRYVYDYECIASCHTDFEIWGSPDIDGDGYPDACDKCPYLYGNQNDDDMDGIGDACDNCAYVYNINQSDFDYDNYGDVCDICPTDSDHSDVNGDGVPDCYTGNCSNGIIDSFLLETSIDYGGYCGTCTDEIKNDNSVSSTISLINPETSIDLGGRCGYCNDSILNGEENIIDYGGHCGNCSDDKKSVLIGETDIDYGGIICGYCENNISFHNDTMYQIIKNNNIEYPFDFKKCDESKGAVFSGVFLLLIIIVVSVLIIVGILIFIFSGLILPVIMGLAFKRKKKKDLYRH
jgi:hypothetical protein